MTLLHRKAPRRLYDNDNSRRQSMVKRVMASKDCNSVPIDVDSNGEEVNVAEVEVDSRHARNTTTLRTGSYKPLADALTPVEEMNVDDLCGNVMKLHLDDGGDGEVTSKFSSGSGTTPKSGVKPPKVAIVMVALKVQNSGCSILNPLGVPFDKGTAQENNRLGGSEQAHPMDNGCPAPVPVPAQQSTQLLLALGYPAGSSQELANTNEPNVTHVSPCIQVEMHPACPLDYGIQMDRIARLNPTSIAIRRPPSRVTSPITVLATVIPYMEGSTHLLKYNGQCISRPPWDDGR
ncbi:hypothetical protein Cgig2_003304 [Carnegiea gigantea]|uniref:Uncharacterized protein n=1 Tax=Carnegiea gigantea TaxID=171969 RepID=A0A9Q1K2L6_9CARY|nr:hypothetical protein Cgig2_003304 [Carnegiea gigantea]